MIRLPRMLATAFDVWRNSRRAPRAIERQQRRRLAALVAFARERSPYYNRLYRELPGAVDDVSLLPPVTKTDLVAHFDEWVTEPEVTQAGLSAFLADESRVGSLFQGKYAAYNTSGTTGERSMILQDRSAMDVSAALAVARGAMSLTSIPGLWRFGSRPRRRKATVIATGKHYPALAITERLRRRLPRRDRYDRTFSVMLPLPDLVRQLDEFRPTVLVGYPHAISVLVDEREAGRLRIDPRVVITFSEMLDDSTRERIMSGFDCAVRNWYGAAEAENIAYDCGSGWLHVNTDWVILEPVDAGYGPVPPGCESDTVLLTNLANRVQPILRYDLGDRVVLRPEPCSCGSPFPAIRVSGRLYDTPVFTSPEGESCSILPATLDSYCFETPGVHRHQLLQTSPDEMRVRVEAKPGMDTDEVWGRLSRHLRDRFAEHGASFVQLELDADLPRPDPVSGKYRTVSVETGPTSPAHPDG